MMMMKNSIIVLLFLASTIATATSCEQMSQLKKRMPEWVGKVPYSHSVNKTWGYPTDCSGFVSWALEVGKDVKAYEYGANKYSTRIKIDDLQYGDIITHVSDFSWDPRHRCQNKNVDLEEEKENEFDMNLNLNGNPIDYLPGHVMFFDKWADKKHENYWAYESTSTDCKEKECFNQHVLYKRKKIEKWSKENCTSSEYGYVEGGARRLSNALLC